MMSHLKLKFFGSPQIELDNAPILFDTRKATALLAYLAINKQTQSREKLASVFWPEAPSDRAFGNLRRTIWSLRQHLSEQWLEVGRQSLTLRFTPAVWVDVHEFQAQIEQPTCARHAPAVVCDRCAPRVQAAIALYTDDFLRGFTLADSAEFDDWQYFQTDTLRERLIDSLRKLIHYTAEVHDLPAAIQYARRWVSLCTWEEAAHRELMRLYILNQQITAAVQQYQECVQILQRELHVAPSPQTTALIDALTHQENETSLIAPDTPEVVLPQTMPLSSAPVGSYQATPFIGRVRERDELVRLLQQPACRVLTILGMGGIGKTRLAQQILIEMAARYPDGVHFIPLAAVTSAEQIIAHIMDALHFTPSDTEDYRTAFFQYLAPKSMLLICDNFEHLLDGTSVLQEMVRQAPALRLLITSRERLHIGEEWGYELRGLAYPRNHREEQGDPETVLHDYDALNLLTTSARRRSSNFTLSAENVSALTRLCQLVDGMPLALELAASWCHLLSCEQLVAELSRSFDVLAAHSGEWEPRHQSVRMVFDSLWGHLEQEDQARLARLAVFQADFDVAAANAIAEMALPQLARFVDRALVQNSANGRFALHPLLQRFLSEQLQAHAPEASAAQTAFERYYRDLLHQHSGRLKTDQQQPALRVIGQEYAHIRRAWESAIAQQDWETLHMMLPDLAVFFEMQSRFQEGHELFQQAVTQLTSSLPAAQNTVVVAQLRIHALICTRYSLYDHDLMPMYQQAMQCVRASADRNMSYTALWIAWLRIGWVQYAPENDDAEEWLDLGERLAEAKGDRWELALATFVRGESCFWRRYELEKAQACYQQALNLRQELGDRWGQAAALNSLGHIALIKGRYQEAQGLHQEALQIAQAIQDRHGILWAKSRLATVAEITGQYQHAWSLNREAYQLAQQLGSLGLVAWRIHEFGRLALLQEQYAEAWQYFQQSQDLFRQIHHRYGIAVTIRHLGRVCLEQGRFEEAESLFQESYQISNTGPDDELWRRYHLGRIRVAAGHPEQVGDDLLPALRMACERQALHDVLYALFGVGQWLLTTPRSQCGLEVVAFLSNHPATPAYIRKQAKLLLTKQARHCPSQIFQQAVQTGRTITLAALIERINSMHV